MTTETYKKGQEFQIAINSYTTGKLVIISRDSEYLVLRTDKGTPFTKKTEEFAEYLDSVKARPVEKRKVKKYTERDPDRTLIQRTYQIYEDQDAFLKKEGQRLSKYPQQLVREAIDKMFNLPKNKK